MGKIIINVTQEDIDSGRATSSTSCPVALALKRTFPKADRVSVGSGDADVYFPNKTFFGILISFGKHYRIKLPTSAFKFIVNYDTYGRKDKYVKPFTFEAELRKR